MLFIKLLVIFIVSYLIGAIPFGFLIGKFKGIDIREHGSNNVGATNVTRIIGKSWGISCFIFDFLKGFLPVIFVKAILPLIITLDLDETDNAILVAATGTIIGHMYPIYLNFNGGKGVATGTGALLAITPLAIISGLLIWGIIFNYARYVSLASIISAITVPILSIVLSALGIYYIPIHLQIFIIIIATIAIYKHKSNIQRLMKGTENKFYKK